MSSEFFESIVPVAPLLTKPQNWDVEEVVVNGHHMISYKYVSPTKRYDDAMEIMKELDESLL